MKKIIATVVLVTVIISAFAIPAFATYYSYNITKSSSTAFANTGYYPNTLEYFPGGSSASAESVILMPSGSTGLASVAIKGGDGVTHSEMDDFRTISGYIASGSAYTTSGYRYATWANYYNVRGADAWDFYVTFN